MKKIDVSTPKHPNTFALVDDCDFDELNKHKWRASGKGCKLYVRRYISSDGKQKALRMHVVIMGRVTGKEIDHRNGNVLDNQRHNLRHCTHAENMRNSARQSNNTSGYKGVSWSRVAKKWQVQIKYNSVKISLGYFFCLIKAAEAYDAGAKKYHGEFANINFNNEPANPPSIAE